MPPFFCSLSLGRSREIALGQTVGSVVTSAERAAAYRARHKTTAVDVANSTTAEALDAVLELLPQVGTEYGASAK